MQRREFIALFGGAAAASASFCPLGARAQQRVPLIGLLNIGSSEIWAPLMATALRQGLGEVGFVEGRNVAIEYRYADGQSDRMPALVADLLRRQVAVMFASGLPVVLAAKMQTANIPIVFFVGEDPVKEGLVASLNRPGGNVTGITNFQNQLFGKQLGLLHEIVPKPAALAFLVNPDNPNAEPDIKDAQAAAAGLGRELRTFKARDEAELEAAFAAMVQQLAGGVLVGVDGFGTGLEQIVSVAARHRIPAFYHRREYPVVGGLMSYGASRVNALRQCGVYVGRILKGEKPVDLPVQQATKFEFVINLKTAKALGLDIPPGVLAIVDEVIE